MRGKRKFKKRTPIPIRDGGRFLYREEKSEGFESDAVAALTVEQHDVVAGKADAVLLPDGEQAAAEYHAGEQEPIDINLDGGLHAGGHGAVNFTLEGGFTGDVEELGTDAENEILIGEDGFLLQGVVLLLDLGDVVAEGFVLVALFST